MHVYSLRRTTAKTNIVGQAIIARNLMAPDFKHHGIFQDGAKIVEVEEYALTFCLNDMPDKFLPLTAESEILVL